MKIIPWDEFGAVWIGTKFMRNPSHRLIPFKYGKNLRFHSFSSRFSCQFLIKFTPFWGLSIHENYPINMFFTPPKGMKCGIFFILCGSHSEGPSTPCKLSVLIVCYVLDISVP